MSLSYLFSLEQIGIKLGLEQIRALVAALGHPDRAYPSIVIAGTNGKGSVTAMVERGLRAAGYRTGRYISPHLVDLEERFAIDGSPISHAETEQLATRVRAAAAALPSPPSFFEATTAMALEAFRDAHVDVAVLEVGLGGRLDATNVVTPVAVGITAIDFDHEQYLGHTIDAIAAEKAGVIKAGGVAVLGRNPPAVIDVIQRACDTAPAELVYAPADVHLEVTMTEGRARLRLRTPSRDYGEVTLALRGRHQVDNALVAVRLLEVLAARGGFTIGRDAVLTALGDAQWPARLELRSWRGGHVLLDGAHNPAGAQALASYVRETYGRRVPFVIGVMRDKKIDGLIEAIAPVASSVYCTAVASPRAAAPVDLAAIVRSRFPELPVRDVVPPLDALTAAHAQGDPVVVAGSLYLAGDIRQSLA